FQAEDGIRDLHVTGVQTCALPISNVTIVRTNSATGRVERLPATIVAVGDNQVMFEAADGTETLHCAGLPERLELERVPDGLLARSEERRVGKACRARWRPAAASQK